jgi:hypothetical protein
MKSPYLAYAIEMVPSVAWTVMTVSLFRPYCLHPTMIQSLIFTGALFLGLSMAIRASRHFVFGRRV